MGGIAKQTASTTLTRRKAACLLSYPSYSIVFQVICSPETGFFLYFEAFKNEYVPCNN